MLVSREIDPEHVAAGNAHRFDEERFSVFWKGHLALEGHRPGEASIQALCELLRKRRLVDIAGELAGVFYLFVYDRSERSWQVSGDTAGLYIICYDSEQIGTGFLDFLDARSDQDPASIMQPHALLEFLEQGGMFGRQTFFADVFRLLRDEVLVIAGDNGKGPSVRVEKKRMPELPPADPDLLFERIREQMRALDGRRIEVDITGGFDSRLLACAAGHLGMTFEGAMSGEAGSPDVLIAREVARCLGVPLHHNSQDLSSVEEDLPVAFVECGGMIDIFKFHRDRQMALLRLERGVDLFVHGGGGELFTDFYFHHEFPFYHRKRPALERLYHLRYAAVGIPLGYLGEKGRLELERTHKRVLEELANVPGTYNCEIYDGTFYHLRTPVVFGPMFTGYVNLGIDIVAPMLDYRTASAAGFLPPWSRFRRAWHRRMITRCNPGVAALATTDGFSASDQWRYLPADLPHFFIFEVKRVLAKASQRYLGKRLFAKAGATQMNAPLYFSRMRGMRQFAHGLEFLVNCGIFRAGIGANEVLDVHVGRILSIGLCLERMKDARSGQWARAGS